MKGYERIAGQRISAARTREKNRNGFSS